MSLINATAAELIEDLEKRSVSSVELTQACLDRIADCDDRVNAFLRVDPTAALEQARRIDERRARGEPLGLLAGLPVAIKDVLCTQG